MSAYNVKDLSSISSSQSSGIWSPELGGTVASTSSSSASIPKRSKFLIPALVLGTLAVVGGGVAGVVCCVQKCGKGSDNGNAPNDSGNAPNDNSGNAPNAGGDTGAAPKVPSSKLRGASTLSGGKRVKVPVKTSKKNSATKKTPSKKIPSDAVQENDKQDPSEKPNKPSTEVPSEELTQEQYVAKYRELLQSAAEAAGEARYNEEVMEWWVGQVELALDRTSHQAKHQAKHHQPALVGTIKDVEKTVERSRRFQTQQMKRWRSDAKFRELLQNAAEAAGEPFTRSYNEEEMSTMLQGARVTVNLKEIEEDVARARLPEYRAKFRDLLQDAAEAAGEPRYSEDQLDLHDDLDSFFKVYPQKAARLTIKDLEKRVEGTRRHRTQLHPNWDLQRRDAKFRELLQNAAEAMGDERYTEEEMSVLLQGARVTINLKEIEEDVARVRLEQTRAKFYELLQHAAKAAGEPRYSDGELEDHDDLDSFVKVYPQKAVRLTIKDLKKRVESTRRHRTWVESARRHRKVRE